MWWLFYFLVFGSLAASGASVIWGLYWAMRHGQFASLSRQASSIHQLDADDIASIDRSCARPCLLLFSTGLVWLLIGTALAMLTSFKMHSPEVLTDQAWLSFGRVRPAHLNVVAYGWCSLAGAGVMLWLFCRLCRVRMQGQPWLIFSAIAWNLGLILGVRGILTGRSVGIEWLEFPPESAFLLFVSLGIVCIWGAVTFARRRCEHVYVSLWYLFGSIFWFPALYVTVQLLLVLMPVRGVTQASITWWYGHNVLGIWFTPIGLATAYYIIPTILARPIHSYYLSLLGFWSLALFYNWAGAHHLISGPIPAWLQAVSIVSSVMMFVPVSAVALNHHLTMRGRFSAMRNNPALSFTVLGAMCYTVVSFQGSLLAIPTINEPFHFTHHTVAHAHLGLYGFFTLVLFGAMYYILPRLVGADWSWPRLIRLHFWSVIIGLALMVLGLTVGGIFQGLEMNQASEAYYQQIHGKGMIEGTRQFFAQLQRQQGAVPFMDIMRGTLPWLWLRTIAGVILTVGHVAFCILVVRLLCCSTVPNVQPSRTTPPSSHQAEPAT